MTWQMYRSTSSLSSILQHWDPPRSQQGAATAPCHLLSAALLLLLQSDDQLSHFPLIISLSISCSSSRKLLITSGTTWKVSHHRPDFIWPLTSRLYRVTDPEALALILQTQHMIHENQVELRSQVNKDSFFFFRKKKTWTDKHTNMSVCDMMQPWNHFLREQMEEGRLHSNRADWKN